LYFFASPLPGASALDALSGRRRRSRSEPQAALGFWLDPKHIGAMADTNEQQPVMLPFRDKDGPGWHVIIRYPEGHERRIDGFASEEDALAWMVENTGELDK
jgi:hypothetical protein